MNIFFITGTSGSGKSTLTELLKAKLSQANFVVYDFDENGVPANADAAWRQKTTDFWIKKAQENSKHHKSTIVCGVVVPSEALNALKSSDLSVYFGFMKISDELIHLRLKIRGWNDQLIQDNVNWAHYLEKEVTQQKQHLIVDCSGNTPEAIADAFAQWISQKKDGNKAAAESSRDQNANNITVPKTKAKFIFKRVTQDDLLLLHKWFQEPHIKEWWPVPEDNDDFFNYFLPKIRSKDTFPFLVLMNDIPLGYIQYYYIDRESEKTGAWLPELPLTTVGIDQFIGDIHYIGKGYGTLLVKDFIAYLITVLEPTITTIILDPTPENHAAIRCYEKVGFKRVGIFQTPYGEALLMRYDIGK